MSSNNKGASVSRMMRGRGAVGRAIRGWVALAVVLVAASTGGYGTLAAALAASPGPSARAANNQGVCNWEGEIVLEGFNFAQVGTVPADGQLLHIANHPRLFEIFGTTFGGNGTSTFGVPDLKGKAPIAGLHYVLCTSGVFPSPSGPSGTCSWLGQIILTAAPLSFRDTVSANGQQLSINNNHALYALYGNTFGGSASSGKFGVPNIQSKVPLPGLHYRVCTAGSFPQPDSGPGRCNWLGQVVLLGFSNLIPYGTIAAHGQLLNLSNNTALFSLFNFKFGGSVSSNEFGVPKLTGKAPPDLHYVVCTRGTYPVQH